MPGADDDPTVTGSYRLVGRGSDLGIDVTGATAEACLAAAVAGIAAAVGTPGDTATRRAEPVALTGATAVELLVGLVDEVIVRLDADGDLAVGLTGARIDDDGLTGALQLVTLADVARRGSAPKAATWHGARLEADGDHWTGHVTIDL